MHHVNYFLFSQINVAHSINLCHASCMETMTNPFKTKAATSVRSEDEKIIVRYHDTDIAKFTKEINTTLSDSRLYRVNVELNTGGWWSATTKKRMNEVSAHYGLGFQVFQRKGKWYVAGANDASHIFTTFKGDSASFSLIV